MTDPFLTHVHAEQHDRIVDDHNRQEAREERAEVITSLEPDHYGASEQHERKAAKRNCPAQARLQHQPRQVALGPSGVIGESVQAIPLYFVELAMRYVVQRAERPHTTLPFVRIDDVPLPLLDFIERQFADARFDEDGVRERYAK